MNPFMSFNKFIIVPILGLVVSGCGLFQANSPSNQSAKDVLATMATAVSVLDNACAVYAMNTSDGKLARDCAVAYNNARDKLATAEKALSDNTQSFVCSVKLAESVLEDFANVYKAKAGKLPDAVVVAESIGRAVGSQCT